MSGAVDIGGLELPIRYFESSMMSAAFPASTRRLQQLTPAPLKLVEVWPGRAAVAIICFDYTKTSIGDYGEVGIAWPVVDSRRKPPPLLPLLFEARWPKIGYWVHHLPVTTEIACSAGRALYGYPKFVADIDYEWRGARRVCTLAADGDEILQLSIDTRMSAKPQQFATTTYSCLDGELLTTKIDVDAVGLRRARGGDARLTLGSHPIGRELAALGMNLSRPAEVRWFPTWRAELPAAHARRRIAPAGATTGDDRNAA